jgi:hypothetical protein
MAPAFACHVLHSAVQTDAEQCKFQRAVRHQYGHLGTTVGTLKIVGTAAFGERSGRLQFQKKWLTSMLV